MAHGEVQETMIFRINVCKCCEDIFMYSKAVNIQQPSLALCVLLAHLL